jgi:hypothetical protein
MGIQKYWELFCAGKGWFPRVPSIFPPNAGLWRYTTVGGCGPLLWDFRLIFLRFFFKRSIVICTPVWAFGKRWWFRWWEFKSIGKFFALGRAGSLEFQAFFAERWFVAV